MLRQTTEHVIQFSIWWDGISLYTKTLQNLAQASSSDRISTPPPYIFWMPTQSNRSPNFTHFPLFGNAISILAMIGKCRSEKRMLKLGTAIPDVQCRRSDEGHSFSYCRKFYFKTINADCELHKYCQVLSLLDISDFAFSSCQT